MNIKRINHWLNFFGKYLYPEHIRCGMYIESKKRIKPVIINGKTRYRRTDTGRWISKEKVERVIYKKYKEHTKNDGWNNFYPEANTDFRDLIGKGIGKGCFITTACMVARGLSDNCLELTVLRNFRDNYMLNDEEMRKEVEEYYDISPKIVSSINSREDSNLIWSSVYEQGIAKAVDMVLRGDFDQAYKHYKSMVKNLNNYLG